MSTAIAVHQSQEPPSITRTRFETLLARNGLDYGITWKWVGRCRHGVIEVYDVSVGPSDGVMVAEEYVRNTHRWSDGDGQIGRMRTDSPKHRAVKTLVARMQSLFIGEAGDITRNMEAFATLKQYLDWAYEIDRVARSIVDFGRSWEPAALPANVRAGQLGRCYSQARFLALSQPEEFTYVEGYACTELFFPIRHAWCVDRNGFVVDPTWNLPKRGEYWGIEFSTEIVKTSMTTSNEWGLLGNPLFFQSLLKNPERYIQPSPQ